ncbi:54_t:CDS:2 [Ambispora leptoticha]|uniref:54_t:CDS:1 n=1 Tax=Ambispora leptoticha TaxID=144679 RepID=A0A9N8VSI8_9GLOM|nr:54_t:CDS:2 [Ambispora leptoticha]
MAFPIPQTPPTPSPVVFKNASLKVKPLSFPDSNVDQEAFKPGDGTCPPEVMSKILKDHFHYLEQCLDIYDSRRPSKSKEKQKELISAAAVPSKTQFELDPKDVGGLLEVDDRDECIALIDSFKTEYENWPGYDSEELRRNIIMHYFDERLSILMIVCHLFRLENDQESIYHELAKDLIDRFQWDAFSDRIYQQFKRQFTNGTPKNWDSKLWTMQSLKEQKSCLEILFLIYYLHIPCPPKRAFEIIEHFNQIKFGLKQPPELVIDSSVSPYVTYVNHVCQVLMVEVLREPNFKNAVLEENPREDTLFHSPSGIMQINELAHDMDQDYSYGVFLICWSCYLQHLQQLFEGGNVPATYGDVESFATDSALIHGNKAIALEVFAYILEIVKGPCFQSDDPNFGGYATVMRELFVSLLEAIDPSMLPTRNYELFVEAFAELHKIDDGFATLLWIEYQQNGPSKLILDTALQRFPQEFRPFIQLMTALSSEEESAFAVFDHLHSVPTCTTKFNTDLNQNLEGSGINVRSINPISVFDDALYKNSLVIPPGTTGVISKKLDGSMIIRWNFQYSAWHLFAKMLQSFSHSNIGNFTDELLLSRDSRVSMISDILDLLKTILKNNSVIPVYLATHWNADGDLDCLQMLYQLLLYVSHVTPLPIYLIGSSMECFSVFVRDRPHEAYYYFSTAKLFSQEHSLERISRGFQPYGHLQFMLMHVESAQGRYPITIALLNFTIEVISKAHQFPTQYNSEFEKLQNEILSSCLSYITNLIFTSYDNWRYVNIEDRFLIGSKIYEIFNRVLVRSAYPSEMPKFDDPMLDYAGNPMGSIQQELVFKFLFNGGIHQISPLLLIVQRGNEFIQQYEKANAIRIADQIKKTLELALTFLSRLLRIRKIVNGSVSLLEHILLGKNGGVKDSRGFLYVIATYINYSYKMEVPTIATDILILLVCTAAELHPPLPSLWGYFGDERETRNLENSFIHHLKNRDFPQMQLAILNFLTVSADYRFGLFIDNNTTSDNIVTATGSTNSPSSKNNNENTATPTKKHISIVRIALDMLNDWKTIQQSTPTVLLALLRLINAIWKNGLYYEKLLQRLRKNDKLWSNFSAILFADLETIPDDWNGFYATADRFISNTNESIIEVYVNICIKAYVLNIISYEDDLSFQNSNGENEINKGKNIKEVLASSAGLELILKNIKENDKLLEWLKEFTQIDYDPRFDQRCLELKEIIPTFNFEELRVLNWNEDYDITRSYGDNYLYDVVATYKLASVMGVDENYMIDIMTRLCQSSHNWSRTDAQVVLFRSFKGFIEVLSGTLGKIFWESKSKKDVRWDVLLYISDIIANEKRVGSVIRIIRNDMANLLLTLLEQTPLANQPNDSTLFGKLLLKLHKAITNDVDSIEDSIKGKVQPAFHKPFLNSTLFALRGIVDGMDDSLSKDHDIFWRFRDTCHRLLARICTILNKYPLKEIEDEDIATLIAIIEKILNPKCISDNHIWMPILEQCNVIPMLLDIFSHSISIPRKDRPSYATNAMDLILLLNKFPLAANKLEMHGIIPIFFNNILSADLREGKLRPNASDDKHEIWCFILAVITRLLCTIGGKNEKFIQNVLGFITLYGKQIQNALSCESPITIGLLEEIERTTMLLYELSLYITPENFTDPNEVSIYYEDLLKLLSKINYLFTHPKTASKVIVPTTRQEKQLSIQNFPKEIQSALAVVLSSSEAKDMNKFLQCTQQKFLTIVRNILATCVILTKAEDILANSPSDALDSLLTFDASSKVGEKIPATIQTLIELSSYGFTMLKFWEQCLTTITDNKKGVEEDLALWQITWNKVPTFLETIFVLTLTQLALATYTARDDNVIQDIILQAAEVKRHLTRVADIVKVLHEKGNDATKADYQLWSLSVVLRGLNRFMDSRLPNDL